jgi:exosome complex component RRP45
VAITLGFLQDGDLVIIDPLISEEYVMQGRLTICMNVYGDILTISMSGGAVISEAVLLQAVEVAKLKATDMTHMMRKALESDAAGREDDVSQMEINEKKAKQLLDALIDL